MTWQLPLKLRIDEGSTSVVFDGRGTAQILPASNRDADTVETLLEDSLEGFLENQSTAGSAQFLGSGFRDGDSKTLQFFDVFHVMFPSKFRGSEISKTYYFSSDSHLLARVTYKAHSGAAVQVNLYDWQDVQGSKVPHVIERLENGIVTMRLNLSSALLTASIDETPFTAK